MQIKYKTLLLILLTSFCKAQSFEYIYSTSEDEQLNDAIEDSSGNFYIIGMKGIFTGNADNYSNILIKLSPSGDSLITLEIPYSNIYALLFKIVRINDTAFVAVGSKKAQSTSNELIWYLKFDNNLNILDEKLIGDTTFGHHANHVRMSLQNELLVTGTAVGSNNGQLFFYRLSLNGDSLQSLYIGDTLNKSGNDMLQLQDTSGYLLFGSGFKLPYTGNIDEVKINNAGAIDTVVELNTCHSNYSEITTQWISDSTFAVASQGFCAPLFIQGIKYQVVDLNNNVIRDTLIGKADSIDITGNRSMDFINPDNIFLGSTFNFYPSWFVPVQAWFRVIKFNSNMQPQWEKLLSHNNDYLFLWTVRATNDGGVLLAGTKYNAATSSGQERDIYVIKLDSLGNFTTGINETSEVQFHDVIVYPNPADNVIHISSTINFNASEITLYDAEGRKVMDKKFDKSGSFSVSQLNAGIYFYEIKDAKGRQEWGKLV
ncbi:MAG: T9SS type A sorting domain-containing protein, partial [Bacteroidota bacterium]